MLQVARSRFAIASHRSYSSVMTTSTPKPVLISGAGLAGLLLAYSLHSNNVPFEIYERDPSGSARSQGYRIRLHAQGLNAIASVLSPERNDEFRAGCTDNGTGQMTSYDAITFETKPFTGAGPPRGGGQVLGVDRAFLRNQLFRGIEHLVHFGKTVTGYKVTSTGVIAEFADGTTSPEGCLLVGADGVRSRVTAQLTEGNLKVFDTGARMIHGSSPRRTFDALSQGRFGGFAISDDENPAGKVKMITNVRDEQGNDVHFGWVLVGGPGTFSAPNDDFSVTGQPAVDISTNLTAKWSDSIRPILTEQKVDEAAFLKMSTSDPKGVPVWKKESRVTVLGDAVHAMTPAGGVGANTALRDAELLGRLLKDGWKADTTENFEDEMRVYASENVKESFTTASKMFQVNELSDTI